MRGSLDYLGTLLLRLMAMMKNTTHGSKLRGILGSSRDPILRRSPSSMRLRATIRKGTRAHMTMLCSMTGSLPRRL